MSEFAYQFLIRLSVMLPVILILATVVWVALKYFGALKTGWPLDARDIRTWPLRFVLADGAAFATTFALVTAWMNGSEWSAAVAGGISALVAIGLCPRLAVWATR